MRAGNGEVGTILRIQSGYLPLPGPLLDTRSARLTPGPSPTGKATLASLLSAKSIPAGYHPSLSA